VPWVIRVRAEAVDPGTGELLGRDAEPGEPGTPFLVAGISETWRDPDGIEHVTYAALTTTPNHLCAPIHDRMPAILSGDAASAWLATPPEETASLLDLLGPYPDELMEAWPVEPFVNDVQRNGPELVVPQAPNALF
jgi:putative SOS response-associated peptidase YedK